MKIDITKYDKADVLRVLYNRARPQGSSFIAYTPGNMTKREAQQLIDSRDGYLFFDYVRGRVVKVDISKGCIESRLYDRDNGQGAAQEAIDKLKEGGQ